MQCEASIEFHNEKISLTSFSRTRCPNGFGPDSHHQSFNITTVQNAPGRLPALSLASDSMSEFECHERSNSVVLLRHRKHLVCRESVHLVWFSHFNRCVCRTHRSVCHRCE